MILSGLNFPRLKIDVILALIFVSFDIKGRSYFISHRERIKFSAVVLIELKLDVLGVVARSGNDKLSLSKARSPEGIGVPNDFYSS